ncbi:response regulator [Massilia sp.]|uniref:response regulator n=1 Tax=Massilia sp. TaxID=1882437 RepID=UPI00289D2CFA|nr:response regulator [Massilia sp.]
MPLNLRRPLHILLVEQDQAIRDLFATLLQGHGYVVTAVDGVLGAIEHASRKPPDVVFSSLVFSNLDGFELCRRLRALTAMAQALIVAVTGYAEAGIRERSRAAGFDAYLLKPVSVDTLLRLLASFKTRRVIANVGRLPGAFGGPRPVSG